MVNQDQQVYQVFLVYLERRVCPVLKVMLGRQGYQECKGRPGLRVHQGAPGPRDPRVYKDLRVRQAIRERPGPQDPQDQ